MLEFMGQPEGYIEKESTSSGAERYRYVYQYTDHLGNIRLSYSDRNNNGEISTDEIIEENNYYPFGLSQRRPNIPVNGRSHQYKYNNTELEEGLGLNWYEMPLRSYDPTTARWNRQDPVVHHGLSTYNSFDNNPIVYADPSGADSESPWNRDNRENTLDSGARGSFGFSSVIAQNIQDNNNVEAYNYGTNLVAALHDLGLSIRIISPNCTNCREGQSRLVERTIMGAHFSYNEYYHSGGLGEDAGWYGEQDYYELFRTIIRAIGQGQASFDVLDDFGFTEDVHLAMVGWAVQAHDYYGGEVPLARGNINAMDFDSPVFILSSLRAVGARFLGASTSEIPIMKNTIGAARAGFSRSPWTLTSEGATAIKRHSEFGKIYKSKSDGLWWSIDNASHGGSHFKVFFESKKGLKWFRDADEFGDFILGKHKGPKGLFIPWGHLKTIK